MYANTCGSWGILVQSQMKHQRSQTETDQTDGLVEKKFGSLRLLPPSQNPDKTGKTRRFLRVCAERRSYYRTKGDDYGQKEGKKRKKNMGHLASVSLGVLDKNDFLPLSFFEKSVNHVTKVKKAAFG